MKKNIVLSGFGNVGREFVKLLLYKKHYLKERYNLEFTLVGVLGSKLSIFNEKGLDIDILLQCKNGSEGLEEYSERDNDVIKSQDIIMGDLLVESTPTDINTGRPGLDIIKESINKGLDIVCISKGALVTNFDQIMRLARLKGISIKYSGATAAALPTVDIAEYSLAGCKIKSIEGILNGTTNYILTKMNDENLPFSKALDEAKEKGIAETNSSLDIKGIDSGCKILLLSNTFLGTNYTIKDINIVGIDKVTKEDIVKGKNNNSKIKLVARAYKEKNSIKIDVSPKAISSDHMLYSVDNTNKAVVFDTDDMGIVSAMGGASSPKGAASAALKDIINVYRCRPL